jgi:hypothetical protein
MRWSVLDQACILVTSVDDSCRVSYRQFIKNDIRKTADRWTAVRISKRVPVPGHYRLSIKVPTRKEMLSNFHN